MMDIAAMQYSGEPTMAYHTDPIVYTVKEQLKILTLNNSSQTLYLGYSKTGSNRACLYIYDTKLWDEKEPIAILCHKEGLHGDGGWQFLDVNNTLNQERNDKNNQIGIFHGLSHVARQTDIVVYFEIGNVGVAPHSFQGIKQRLIVFPQRHVKPLFSHMLGNYTAPNPRP